MIDYYNYPKDIELDFYHKARRVLINAFKNNPCVIAIYEYGTINAPGISDIDIILVINKKKKNFFKENYNQLKEISNLIGSGNIIHMTAKSFSMIKFIDDIKIKKIYGKTIYVKLPNKEDKEFIDLVSIVDWVPERVSRLINIFKSQKIDIITTLCILNSLSYSILKSKKIFGFKDNSFVDNLNNLRQNWNQVSNNKKELYKLIKDAKLIGERLMTEYANFLKEKKLFITDYNKIDNQKATISLYIKNQIGINVNGLINIPKIFYYHFAYYASLDLELSKKLKKKINGYKKFNDKIINSKYKDIMSLKINISNYDYSLLKYYKLNNGIIRFGYLI